MYRFEKKLWLATPTMHGDEMKFIREAYDTNWMSTVGENINVIEREVSAKLGCGYGVALGCGTAALHLAVRLAALKVYGLDASVGSSLSGKKVFCSDMTFLATVNPVIYEGGEPVFIDTERDTWNMDPVALEKAFALYPDTKIVILAHLYGTPSKIAEIKDVCSRYGAVLVEDAAECVGAYYCGKPVGSFGDYNVISFNGNKIITGSAGGMFLTDDRDDADVVRKWSTQSRDPAPWYRHSQVGFNYRISNVIAGVIRGQLPYLEDHIARKKAIFERYKAAFEGLPVTMNPFEEDKSKPNYWLSCILIDESVLCGCVYGEDGATYEHVDGRSCPAEILDKLAAYNAEGRPIWKPMHSQKLFESSPFVSVGDEDIGMDIFKRGLCLPSDIKMTEEEQDNVIEIVKSCF